MYICVTVQLSNRIIELPVIIVSLCVCARVCVGINVYIFVDVIMILCMHIFFSAAIQWIIVSLHDPQSLNVGLETFMYACREHACIPPF